MTGRQLGLRVVSLGEDVRVIAPAAQRMGYQGVQLDVRMGELDLCQLSGSGRREVRHLFEAHDLKLASVRMQVEGNAIIGQSDRALWAVQRVMEAAVGLGVKTVCVDLGQLPIAANSPTARPSVTPKQAGLIILPEMVKVEPVELSTPADEQAWITVDGILREVGQLADRMGLTLAFSSELSSLASVKRAAVRPQCPLFGVDLDAVSMLRDRWSLDKTLDEVGALTRHVRARDALQGSGGRTRPAGIGQGSLNWPELLVGLDDGGYGGWVIVDTVDLTDRVGEARRALAVLRDK